MIKRKFSILGLAAFVFVIFWAIVTFMPFIYMVLTSLKDRTEIFGAQSVFALPKTFKIGNYTEILFGNYLSYLKNSVLVCVLSLVILLACASMSSYIFARLNFKFGTPLLNIVIACMAIPVHATLIPVFLLTKEIGLYDSPFALVGPYVAFNLPVSVFILTGFMRGIPKELEEAAEIDGASKVRIFLQIIMPLSVPGLATLAIYNGINMWNEFVYAMSLTTSMNKRTLPLAIWEYSSQYGPDIPMTMAILVLSALPMIILFLIFQEKLEKGMMAGAVKG